MIFNRLILFILMFLLVLPFTSSAIFPNSLSNSDGDSLDYLNVDELADGDSVYEFTGKSSDPVDPAWIECGYSTRQEGRNFTNQSFGGTFKLDLETVDNENFWLIDNLNTSSVKISYVNVTGGLISQFDSPVNTVIGIATVDGSEFWFIGIADIIYHTDNTGQIINNISVDSQFSTGIATVDGSEFWITDNDPINHTIYKVNNSGSTLNIYDVDFVSAVRKIDTIDGSDFWFTDNIADMIWHTDSNFNLISSIDVSHTCISVSGITSIDGANFWIIQSIQKRVFEIPSTVPPNINISNMTIYWGHYVESDWNLTIEDNYTGIVWGNGTNFYNITDYTVSTSDIDESYTLIKDLPTAKQFNDGVYLRFIGYDTDAGGEDDLFLDYCYFDVGQIDTDYPQITLLNPSNNTIEILSNDIIFTYNVFDYTSGIANCSLYINGILNETDITITENINQTFSQTLINGYYNWSIECTDDSADINTNMSVIWLLNINISIPPIPPIKEFKLTVQSCPIDDTATGLMFVFLFVMLIIMLVISETLLKIPFFSMVIGLGFIIYSFSVFGCSEIFGIIVAVFGLGAIVSKFF